mmetsp:Transcript_11015/g.17886  ORF Transcript_11015/g.17886 Transcript_11015/m.17886 type:complete len:325 (+) Transcript_11015:88-1062(+)
MEILYSCAWYGAVALLSTSVPLVIVLNLGKGALRFREFVSKFPMGLNHSRKRGRAHSLLKCSNDRSTNPSLIYDKFLKGLNRSARTTLKNQVDKEFRKNGLRVKTVAAHGLSLEHLPVIYSHECRSYNFLLAPIVSFLRFLSSSIMTGYRDEYRIDGRLVAYSQFIIKGSTLRAMWFYQRAEVSRYQIWFHSLRANVQRGLTMHEICTVDAGPSGNKDITRLKEKFGFETVKDWRNNSDYKGEYVRQLPREMQFLGSRCSEGKLLMCHKGISTTKDSKAYGSMGRAKAVIANPSAKKNSDCKIEAQLHFSSSGVGSRTVARARK